MRFDYLETGETYGTGLATNHVEPPTVVAYICSHTVVVTRSNGATGVVKLGAGVAADIVLRARCKRVGTTE